MDMTDNDKFLADLFKQAAQQQIEDNGFTERVMQNLPDTKIVTLRRLSRLWSLFCILVAMGLFFAFGGWESLKASVMVVLQTVVTWLSVFLTTAPTTEIPVNPVVILLLVAFVGVYLPYRTYRKLSAAL